MSVSECFHRTNHDRFKCPISSFDRCLNAVVPMLQVMLECAGLCQTVFLISGLCQAVDIKLDTTSVPFGAVVIGSQSSRVLVMQNLGDIGARFSWNMNEFSSDFSVEPVKGYSSPGAEVSFQLTFSPEKVSQDIRSEVRIWRLFLTVS